MNTRSLSPIDRFSKWLAFLKPYSPGVTASLRGKPFDLEHQSVHSLKQIEAFRHLEQIYRLERRNFF